MQAYPVEQQYPYRWVILCLVACCFLFTFITRMTWPPLIPVVAPILKMKMSQAGALMSAFYLGYVITQIPAGMLADRVGVRVILAVSLIMEGLSTSSMGFMNSYETGFALRVLAGLGAGAVFSCCTLALMEWFPKSERGLAFGVLLAAPSGGILVTNLAVPWLNKLIGWQAAFRSVGSLTVMAGIMVLLLMRSAASVRPQDKALMGGFKIIFGSRDLILTALAGFCLLWLQLSTVTWANAYIKKLGFSITDAGLIMALYGLAGVLAPLVTGIFSDRMKSRKLLILVAYCLTIPLCIIFGYQTSYLGLAVVAFLVSFCSWSANPQLTILISQFAGVDWAATANGTANFIFQLASMIGPFVMGWAIDFTGSFTSVWWIMAAGPLLGIFLVLPVNERARAA